MYWSPHDILSHNCLYNFSIGNRGAGKTFGSKAFVIKKFIETGAQFIYLRRYKTEFDGFQNFFADVSHKFPDHEFEVKGKLLYIDGKIAGYGIALSTALTKKSISYHLVETIIFDEFIIDKGHIRYLSNEVTSFLEFYETVARMRDNVRVLFLANAVSVVNPYFLFWNMKPKSKKRFTKFKHMIVEYIQNKEFIEAKYKTRFGQIIKGTTYGDYAIENQFLTDNLNFVEKKTGNARHEFSVVYNGHTYGFWSDYKIGLVYVSEDTDPYNKQVYTLSDIEHGPNLMLIKNVSKSFLLKGAIQAYEGGFMRFEDLQIKNQAVEIFDLLKG